MKRLTLLLAGLCIAGTAGANEIIMRCATLTEQVSGVYVSADEMRVPRFTVWGPQSAAWGDALKRFLRGEHGGTRTETVSSGRVCVSLNVYSDPAVMRLVHRCALGMATMISDDGRTRYYQVYVPALNLPHAAWIWGHELHHVAGHRHVNPFDDADLPGLNETRTIRWRGRKADRAEAARKRADGEAEDE